MQLCGAGPPVPHVKSGVFNKGVNPTVVPKCCILWRSARPGPCCQRFLKMFAVIPTASATAEGLRVSIRSRLLSKQCSRRGPDVSCHFSRSAAARSPSWCQKQRKDRNKSPHKATKQLVRQQRDEIEILSQKRGITLLPEAAGETGLVAALSLSRLELPSRSNLPKDPPSKTATLHKKDDTDTRIIFKSCGTACSLLRFQRLAANFLLCLPALGAQTWTTTPHKPVFIRLPTMLRNEAAQQRSRDAPQKRV